MAWIFTLIVAVLLATAPAAPTLAQSVAGLMDKDKLAAVISAETGKLAANPQDAAALKTLGVAYHNLASLKVDGTAADAVATLTKAVDLLPDDAEALAYLGSAYTMSARDSWNVVDKVKNVNKGIALLDKALRKDGDNIRLRILRANNALALPGMFERKPVAKEDFAFVASRFEASGRSDPVLLSEIYFKLAGLYGEEGDAAKRSAYLTKARETAPASPWAQKAEKEAAR